MDDVGMRQGYERLHDPTRVLALSDGVFAIILTLLVLELHVPDLAGGATLEQAMREIWPSLLAFLISFVVVAIAWVVHRDLFSLIRRTDRALLWLNLLYLLPLCLLPFGATLLSRYQSDPVALRIYGILLIAIFVTRLIIWIYASGRPHLLVARLEPRLRWTGAILTAVPGIAYAVAFAIARVAPRASLLIYVAVPVLHFVALAFARTAGPPGSAEQDFA